MRAVRNQRGSQRPSHRGRSWFLPRTDWKWAKPHSSSLLSKDTLGAVEKPGKMGLGWMRVQDMESEPDLPMDTLELALSATQVLPWPDALERGLTWGLTLGWTLPSLGWELEHPKPGFAKASWAAPLPGPLLQGNHTSGLISSFCLRLFAVSCSPRHKNDSFGVSTQWLNLGVVSCYPNTNNSYLFHHLLFLNWVNTQVT